MTVLIVDDQIRIISGLISGLNWDTLGITSIHTAANAAKAKVILEREQIDILLCDIEMPGENGLALLRWAREQGMDFVCVFLTAHADFEYAKEAIQLGCFDYILQPAKYEDIQATVSRAIQRAESERIDRELKQYGSFAKNNPTSLFQTLFVDWFAGNPLSASRLRVILSRLELELRPGCDCAVVVGNLLNWHAEPWTTEEWVYGLNNIMSEIFSQIGCETIYFSIDRMTVGWFLFAPYGRFSDAGSPLAQLKQVYPRIAEYYPCDFAFYVGQTVPLEQVSPQAKNILQARKNNVTKKSGVFPVRESAGQSHGILAADEEQVQKWQDLLYEGASAQLLEEIFQYLELARTRGKLDYTFLTTFWVQFQQIVINVIWVKRMDGKKILPLLTRGEHAQTILEIREIITAIAAYFDQSVSAADEKDDLIRQIEKYVDEHLEQPLSVSDVAEAMYMNPDYLSRVFKSKKGTSLKEYILGEKMHTAQALLQTTNLPISIVASKLGYDNYSYFSQVYRKVMGVSPTSERKK